MTTAEEAPIIDAYGEGTTITSAMKSLTATVNSMLDSIIYDGTWDEHVGKVENLGLVSKDDMSLNYVRLPEDTTQWNDDFGLEDYKNREISALKWRKLLQNREKWY